MSLLVLSSDDVSKITSELPPTDLLNLMALVFARFTLNSGVASPHRTSIKSSHHNVLFMPSRIAGLCTAIKVVAVPTSQNDSRGLPASTFVVDEGTGSVKAVVNARKLTALRNAAGSALATKLALGSSATPKTLVTFGAGAQIEAHIDLLLRTFPESLTECAIFNRTMSTRLDQLVSSLRQRFCDVTFITNQIPLSAFPESEQNLKQTIESADIICTATPSTQPLFPGRYVKPGAHINLIGSYQPSMIEVDKELVDRAGMIIVDSKEACLVEAGDLISAGVSREKMVELGELIEFEGLADNVAIEGAKQERFGIIEDKCEMVRNQGDVTIFKSVGVGIQDVAIASLVVTFAEETGVGTRIDYDI